MTTDYNKERRFIHLLADEEKVITDFKEGGDILNYHSSKSIYCPMTTDVSRYYEIDDAKDAEYRTLQERAVDEMLKNKGL